MEEKKNTELKSHLLEMISNIERADIIEYLDTFVAAFLRTWG